MGVKENTDNRDLIQEYLNKNDRSLLWLSKKTGIPYATMYSCFIQRNFKISEENLSIINKVLKTDFTINQ